MEITPLFLVLAAVIGLLIGVLVSGLFSTRDSKKELKNAPPPELAKEGFTEVARLWYSPSGKKVITEVDGEHYRDYQVLSPEQKSRIKRMISLWSDWAGIVPDVKVEKAAPVLEATPPTQNEALAKIGPVLDWSVAEALKTPEQKEAADQVELLRPKTVAGQISEIIDRMLEGNPLREKGIKLIENNHHGVDVWIGMEKFDGVDAVPNPEARQLIREAVAQWEREMETKQNPLIS